MKKIGLGLILLGALLPITSFASKGDCPKDIARLADRPRARGAGAEDWERGPKKKYKPRQEAARRDDERSESSGPSRTDGYHDHGFAVDGDDGIYK